MIFSFAPMTGYPLAAAEGVVVPFLGALPAFLHLGQLPYPTMEQFWTVIVVLVALGSIALMVKWLMPPKREPSIEVEFATKAEVKAMIGEVIEDLKEDQTRIEDRITRVEEKLDDGFESSRKDTSQKVGGLHKRMDDFGAALGGQTELLNFIKRSLRVNVGGQRES